MLNVIHCRVIDGRLFVCFFNVFVHPPIGLCMLL